MIPTVRQIKSELSRRSLIQFVKNDQPSYQDGWFHRDLARELEEFYAAVLRGENPRLMIFAPPQHGKSTLVSQYFPAWAIGKSPNLRFVNASYASVLSEKNCSATQAIMMGDAFTSTFPRVRIGKDTVSTSEIKKKQNSEIFEVIGNTGSYKAVGVGGGLTGFPMDIGVIDDPFKDHEEAYSPTIRQKVFDWYSTVFFLRKAPQHGIIIINTRWHTDDLCGRLIDQEPESWKIVNYRGIAEADEEHRKKGEALHPDRYPLAMLEEVREKYPVFFAAMYQGNPIPQSGSIFNSDMFGYGKIPETFDYEFIMADTAYNDKKENDFTVFTAFGVENGNLFVTDVYRKQIKAAEVEAPATVFCKAHQRYGFRGAYIEPKGHGIYLNQVLPQKGVIMPSAEQLKEFFSDRNKDKVERANNAVPWLGVRKIIINEAINDKETLLAEVLTFPKARHDDFCDTVIDGVKFTFARQVSLFDVL